MRALIPLLLFIGCTPSAKPTPCRSRAPKTIVVRRAAQPRQTPNVRFMRRIKSTNPQAKTPLYELIADQAEVKKLSAMLDNEAARTALTLFELAKEVAGPQSTTPRDFPLHIAVARGGNHAVFGFQLRSGTKTYDMSQRPFIRLAPRPASFSTTLLHETGHVVLRILGDGKGLATDSVSSVLHSTPTITDRNTAFNEGFAISLETIRAHLSTEPSVKKRYHHHLQPSGKGMASEYFFRARDLATYAQTFGRYTDVRDNHFSFASSTADTNYLRVQLDRSRDFSRLRTADQLLASEGFYATFFFRLAEHAVTGLEPASLRSAYTPIFKSLRAILLANTPASFPPWLAHLVEQHIKVNPNRKRALLTLLFDLSHGAFFTPAYQTTWTELYFAAQMLDLKRFRKLSAEISKLREGAVTSFVAGSTLFARFAPKVLRVTASVHVPLPVLFGAGKTTPFTFDPNTVQLQLLGLIKGFSKSLIEQFDRERSKKPFASGQDLFKRVPLTKKAREGLTVKVF